MKKEFFNEMSLGLGKTDDVEILTDSNARSLKGGGCTCKKSDSFSCGTYNDTTNTPIDVPISI